MSQKIKITRIKKSKIQDLDFNNFSFGSVFTDHMFECDFIDGKWVNPIIKPYQPISIEPSASVLHYGQAIFEGMKAYKDENANTDNYHCLLHFIGFIGHHFIINMI